MNHLDATSECELCVRLHSTMFDFLARYQYDLTYSAEVRRNHAEVGGFCPLHTWQYAELASPRGVCTAYADVCRAWSQRLKDIQSGDIRRLMPDAGRCPACRRRDSAEQEELGNVVAQITEEQSGARSLCLSHLGLLVNLLPLGFSKLLVENQASVYAEIAENMEHYASNDRPGARGGITAAQRVAHRVGLSRLVGHRRLVAPWEFEKTI